jgi:hypothetical protein
MNELWPFYLKEKKLVTCGASKLFIFVKIFKEFMGCFQMVLVCEN